MWDPDGYEVSSPDKNMMGPEAKLPSSNKEAFSSGDFIWQARMMDAMITGLERNNLGFT